MTAETPMLEISAMIVEAGGGDLLSCMQCGTCTGVCPWPMVERFSPRSLLRQMALGLEGWEEEAVWRCVTCRACEKLCPRDLNITDILRAARGVLQQSGNVPRSLAGPLASLRTWANPWEGNPSDRVAWPKNVSSPLWNPACIHFFFPCCTQIHDPRNRRASRDLISLLHDASVSFGTLAEPLRCCGEQARKLGSEDLFQELISENLQVLRSQGVTRMFTSSPHCLHAFRDLDIPCEHTVQLLWRTVEQERITPTLPVPKVVTYHDPCYLGRYAGVYDAPRRLIASIPGVELREMPRHGEDSLCCGGGGGGLFLDVPAEQRFAVHRVREAKVSGASVLATACPYCLIMFEDAVKILEMEQQIEVLDVAELLRRAVPIGAHAEGAEGAP